MAVLTAAVALAALLPLAGAVAGQTAGDAAESVRAEESVRAGEAVRAEESVRAREPVRDQPKEPAGPLGADALDADPLDAERCGPELASPDGVEAQTCVLFEGERTWARTYYRNATGDALRAVLVLMGPGGRTVQTHCAVAAGEEPGACDTPRERVTGERSAYTAIAEFAAPEREALDSGAEGAESGGQSELLLRVGSNPA
ncbi:hypothetical protein [Streptomyces apocyni]|uniref:hypothetical protein n=1 Tax=Streptomyces apocyni TaxID=2654677 RepID=UPI0012EAF24C|nr:hypothetical protein [Streptomyces apocyni]